MNTRSERRTPPSLMSIGARGASAVYTGSTSRALAAGIQLRNDLKRISTPPKVRVSAIFLSVVRLGSEASVTLSPNRWAVEA